LTNTCGNLFAETQLSKVGRKRKRLEVKQEALQKQVLLYQQCPVDAEIQAKLREAMKKYMEVSGEINDLEDSDDEANAEQE
jgi:hypothetical protein